MTSERFLNRLSQIADNKAAFIAGMGHCFGVPALGIGASMTGFGAMAHELGLPWWFAFNGAVLIWALPGQVAMNEMASLKVGFLFSLLAVSFANMRLLPITVTGITVIMGERRLSWLVRFILSHFLAVTGWTAIMLVRDYIPRMFLLPYYIGFVSLLFFAGISGTMLGYFSGGVLPEPIVGAIVFITPLYLMLLILNPRQKMNMIAVLIGVVGGLGLYPFIGNWSIFVAGVGGGTIAFFASNLGKN